jgi:hypothetical protein
LSACRGAGAWKWRLIRQIRAAQGTGYYAKDFIFKMKVEVREYPEGDDDHGEDQDEAKEVRLRGGCEASGFGLDLLGLKQIMPLRKFVARARALRRIA